MGRTKQAPRRKANDSRTLTKLEIRKKQKDPISTSVERVASQSNQTKKRKSLIYSEKTTLKKRYRPGMKALKEIRHYQKTVGYLIPKLPFARLVRDIIEQLFGNRIAEFRIQKIALEALQEATEAYMVQFFEDCVLCCLHAKRVTVIPRDIFLARRLRERFIC